MNSVDLPKSQQDFMRTLRGSLEVSSYDIHIEGFQEFGQWQVLGQRAIEFGKIKQYMEVTDDTRARMKDAADMILQIDEHTRPLFEILLKEIQEKYPEKRDNISQLQFTIERENNGLQVNNGANVPFSDLRSEFRNRLKIAVPEIEDPRVEILIRAHEKMITKNPIEGFGGMTNWLSRFPDFDFLKHVLDEETTAEMSKPIDRSHPGLYIEAKKYTGIRGMPSMYISAAIDHTEREERRQILDGVRQGQNAWRKFWNSVTNVQRA